MSTKKTAPTASPSGTMPTAVTTSPPSGSPAAPVATHCPYRQSSLLQQALTPDKMRVAFFLGAGCPVAIKVPDGAGNRPLIPDVAELTKQVGAAIAATPNKDAYATIVSRVINRGIKEPSIENILTHLRGLIDIIGSGEIDGLKHKDLMAIDDCICSATTTIVTAALPGDRTPYHQLATWIGGIPRANPIELFTSNYDLLAEQALEQIRVPFFDGFVGSDRTFFDIASMELDSLPARWARLWKVHGSVNWWRTKNGNVERRRESLAADDRQMSRVRLSGHASV